MARIDSTYYQNAALSAYSPTGNWKHLYAAPLMAESDGTEASWFGRDGFRGVGDGTGPLTPAGWAMLVGAAAVGVYLWRKKHV